MVKKIINYIKPKLNSINSASEKVEPLSELEVAEELKAGEELNVKSLPMKKILLCLGVFLLLFLSISVTLGFYTYQTAIQIKQQANLLKDKSSETYTLFKDQNLPAVEENLNQLEQQLFQTKQTYQKLAFYSYLPVAKNYFNDGLHGFNAAQSGLSAAKKSIQAITPYADVLGFSGEGSFTGGTTEDRLKVILETLDKIAPILDEITNDLKSVESELAAIDF